MRNTKLFKKLMSYSNINILKIKSKLTKNGGDPTGVLNKQLRNINSNNSTARVHV